MKLETLQCTSVIASNEKFKPVVFIDLSPVLSGVIVGKTAYVLAEKIDKKFYPNNFMNKLFYTPISNTDHCLDTLSVSIDDITY